MNVLSLFDGMSCGRIALERAGIKLDNYYASEIDKYAIKVSEANYPDIIRLGDVTKVRIDKGRHIDLLIAGSPCQGFSFAGKQLNFEDPRSKLFFEFVRILKECKRYNPNVKFLLENVNMKKEFLDTISEHLGVQPVRINSSLLSAQMRDRWYWTNINFDKNITDKELVIQDILESGFADKSKAFCLDASYYKGGNQEKKITLNEKEWRKLTLIECERLQTVPDNYTSSVSNSQRYKMLGNGWTVDVIAHIFKYL